KTSNEDISDAKVNDTIRKQISTQDNISETDLQKRKVRLFNNIG
ncbi:2189_t:CDS:1, partial [Funneliformis geosporum]